MKNYKTLIGQFAVTGEVEEVVEWGEGMINNTYRVAIKDSQTHYILQKINHQVFKDIDLLQNNILKITSHIRRKLAETGETDIDRKVLTLIPAKDEKLYYFDGESYWRMMILIPGSKTLQSVTPVNAYMAGRAFGRFQSMLSDIPESLGETIPDFHNMEFRLKQFREAVNRNSAGRLQEVATLVAEIENRSADMCLCEQLHREGILPKRINHCDTKVNNILFDEDGNVLCVIDLDTTMPGFVVSDYGDFMRSAGNMAAEDEKDLSRVGFNMEIFRSYTKGYLEEATGFLSLLETELLPHGAKRITYMQVVRFLTDYLNGDCYYKVKYPVHNLIRAYAQFKLLQDIETKYESMMQFVNEVITYPKT